MITTARRKLESDLTNLIKAIAYWDIHIENYKIGIAENHQFNIFVAFDIIDTGRKGLITDRNIHNFLSSNQMNCSHKECLHICNLFFRRVPIDEADFTNFLLPKTNQKLRQFHLDKGDKSYDNIQIQFARECMKRLFERILVSVRELQKLREHLQSDAQFDVLELWKIISAKNPVSSGDLTQKCLTDFVKSNGSHFSSQEFEAILRYLQVEQSSQQDFITQMQFNYLLMPPEFVFSSNFNDEIKERVLGKFDELGIAPPQRPPPAQSVLHSHGYNFRKVFDPVREGRPQFKFDSKYMDQLREYKQKFLAPSRNYALQYRDDPQQIRDHDFFFKDFYLHLHNEDQEELYFNRFGKRYAYS